MSESSGDAGAEAQPAGDPVDAFLAWLRVERNCSPATLRAYAADLDQLARFCATGETAAPVSGDPGYHPESRDLMSLSEECEQVTGIPYVTRAYRKEAVKILAQ